MIKPPTFPAKLTTRLRSCYALRIFVETGSLRGRSAAYASTLFERVFSVELSPHFFCDARRFTNKLPGVQIFFGSSPNVLPLILPQLIYPTLFWLDAHWSGCGTPRLGIECPLLDELRVIGGLRECDVVLIDDARLFVNPPNGEHRNEEWPTLDDIRAVVADWAGDVHVEVIDDTIAITRKPIA